MPSLFKFFLRRTPQETPSPEEAEEETESEAKEDIDVDEEVEAEYTSSTSEELEGDMVPMIPDPQWLEKNGWEYVAFRRPTYGEIYVTMHLEISVGKRDESLNEIWGEKRWIIRPKASKASNTQSSVTTAEAPTPPDMPSVPDVIL